MSETLQGSVPCDKELQYHKCIKAWAVKYQNKKTIKQFDFKPYSVSPVKTEVNKNN